jgi:hypothetical protein
MYAVFHFAVVYFGEFRLHKRVSFFIVLWNSISLFQMFTLTVLIFLKGLYWPFLYFWEETKNRLFILWGGFNHCEPSVTINFINTNKNFRSEVITFSTIWILKI